MSEAPSVGPERPTQFRRLSGEVVPQEEAEALEAEFWEFFGNLSSDPVLLTEVFNSRRTEHGPDGTRFRFNKSGPPWWELEDASPA
jgi:hypothetical protein